MPLRLYAKNFRVINEADWRPQRISLLVGANGTGKTTLLEVLDLLRYAFRYSVPEAVRYLGGVAGMRNLDAPREEPVTLGIEIGAVRWELQLGLTGGALQGFSGERLWVDETLVLQRAPGVAEWSFRGVSKSSREDEENRVCLRALWDKEGPPELEAFVSILRAIRVYDTYSLKVLRDRGSEDNDDVFLNPQGTNLFSVLRNWRNQPVRHGERFRWVVAELAKAFPGMIDEIEFTTEGRLVTGRFFGAGRKEPDAGLPFYRAAEGLMTGLLHLTALAGLAPEGIMAIDEMENQLHPHAIRSLLTAMRARAAQHSQTVLLTTHSPVLMNLFRDTPEHLYVMEEGQPVVPVALDQLYDPEWLHHFALGDLYVRQQFGAPPKVHGEME